MATLTYAMPQDGDWDPAFWDRVGEGPGWAQVEAAFKAAGAEVDDTEDVTLEFRPRSRERVLKVVKDARRGKYGEDVRTYWREARRRKP